MKEVIQGIAFTALVFIFIGLVAWFVQTELARAVDYTGMKAPLRLEHTLDMGQDAVLNVYCDQGYRIWVITHPVSPTVFALAARDVCPIDVNQAR